MLNEPERTFEYRDRSWDQVKFALAMHSMDLIFMPLFLWFFIASIRQGVFDRDFWFLLAVAMTWMCVSAYAWYMIPLYPSYRIDIYRDRYEVFRLKRKEWVRKEELVFSHVVRMERRERSILLYVGHRPHPSVLLLSGMDELDARQLVGIVEKAVSRQGRTGRH